MNRKLNLLVIGILIFMIGPFIILFFFNNPTPEDFSWSETTRNLGYIDAQRFYYNIWSGRYFSYLILSINPLLFKSFEGYKIFLLLFFLLFNYLIFLFISQITKDVLIFSERLLLTLSFIFLYLYAMPSVSEGFYWMTAVMIYHVGIMLLMLLIILFKKLESVESVPLRFTYTLFAVLIIAAAAGTSEITSMLTFLLAGIFLIRASIFRKSLQWISLMLLVAAGISVFIAFSSPGNYLRSAEFGNSHNLTYSLQHSFMYLIKSLFSWIFVSPLLVFTVLLSPLLLKLFNNKKKISNRFIFLRLTAFIFLLYGIIFSTVWNTGESPYGRTGNVVYFIFLFGWFYNCMFLVSYVDKKVNVNFNKFPLYV
ncbi:MAG: DUF6056 family protein, partial [bacterium]